MPHKSKLMNWFSKLKLKARGKRVDSSYGVLVVKTHKEPKEILILQNPEGYWGLPKGHAEKGESMIEAASRELLEEAGIKPRVELEPVFEAIRIYDKKGIKVQKTNHFFLSFIDTDLEIVIQKSEIKDFKWTTFDEALMLFDTESYLALKQCLIKMREYIEK